MVSQPPTSRVRAPVADDVLAEQLEYYRARAAEYDEWFLRQGRYDRGDGATARWRDEAALVRGWLTELALEDADVLELAAGTGIWTHELLVAGARVTAVDAAPEMLDELRRRIEPTGLAGRLQVVEADVYAWSPPGTFDAVVACFFMSHVPDERFDGFLALAAAALKDRGRLFLLDGIADPTSTAADHVLPGAGTQLMTRRLNDGREFAIVKRFRTAGELVEACERVGLAAEVRETETYFQAVLATRG